MKILFLINDLRSGGQERQLVELLKSLSAHKDIICELALLSNDIHYTEVNKLKIQTHFLIRKKRKSLGVYIHLIRLCKKIKPNLIHTWTSMTSIYAMPIARLLRIKIVNGMIRTVLGKSEISEKLRFRARLTFPFSDKIVSNSLAGLQSFNAPEKKSICIYNGFDFNRIKNLQTKKSVRERFGLGEDYVIGMVASYLPKKDYHTYFSVTQKILLERDDVTFFTIGDGDYNEFHKITAKSEFRSKFRILGKQKDIESIINIFNIGVLATETKMQGEGISNVIMEYMALGKPVVASDFGGTRELVIHQKTGFLVEPNNIEDMYMRIKQLLDDNKLAVEMGKAGHERIKSKFTLEKMKNEYIKLYKDLAV